MLGTESICQQAIFSASVLAFGKAVLLGRRWAVVAFGQAATMEAGDVLDVVGDEPSTRRTGSSHATTFDVGHSGAYGSTLREPAARRSKRRVLVAAGVAAALVLCTVAAAGNAWGNRGSVAGELLGRPGAQMNSAAWRALHSQFQHEDAELEAQLGIARLPSLKDVSSGVSSDVMSSALGDSSIAGLASAGAIKGAARLRILKRYGEKGESMDNDMGFSGNAGPYAALLQTSAIVGDPMTPGSARVLPMLLETDPSSFADKMSENGLSANDSRWPASAAKSSDAMQLSEAAKAAQQLISSEKKAWVLSAQQEQEQRNRFLQHQARELEQKLAAAATHKAIKTNSFMQQEQERQDADDDGHIRSTGNSEYDAHYQSLLSTGEGIDDSMLWQNPAAPVEDQRPRHQRLAYNDAIQHWADAENRAGVSPNEPRSSATPLGIPTIRLAPLRAALRERIRDAQAARMQQAQEALEEHEQRQEVLREEHTRLRAEARLRMAGGDTQQLSFGIGGIGSGEDQGNDKDWRVAIEVDPNCKDTLADMAAGSLGALIHGSDDCLPNAKKLPVMWPYGKPGDNWQSSTAAADAVETPADTKTPAETRAVDRQLLVQTAPVWTREREPTRKVRSGRMVGLWEERHRGEGVLKKTRQVDSKVVKVLEKDLREATRSEGLAMGAERQLRWLNVFSCMIFR